MVRDNRMQNIVQPMERCVGNVGELRIVRRWNRQIAQHGQLVLGELELVRGPIVVMRSLEVADGHSDRRLSRIIVNVLKLLSMSRCDI